MTLNEEWPDPPEEFFLTPDAQLDMELVLEVGDRLRSHNVPYSFPLTAFVVAEVEEDGTAILWPSGEAATVDAWAS